MLLGLYPGRELVVPAGLPDTPPPIPAALPADLIARRPALAAAERRLAASDERYEAARRDRYPRLSLTASGGTSTFFGLLPLLLEKSMQAKFMVPMAISLGFGVIFSAFISLVPAGYMITEDVRLAFVSLPRFLRRLYGVEPVAYSRRGRETEEAGTARSVSDEKPVSVDS